MNASEKQLLVIQMKAKLAFDIVEINKTVANLLATIPPPFNIICAAVFLKAQLEARGISCE